MSTCPCAPYPLTSVSLDIGSLIIAGMGILYALFSGTAWWWRFRARARDLVSCYGWYRGWKSVVYQNIFCEFNESIKLTERFLYEELKNPGTRDHSQERSWVGLLEAINAGTHHNGLRGSAIRMRWYWPILFPNPADGQTITENHVTVESLPENLEYLEFTENAPVRSPDGPICLRVDASTWIQFLLAYAIHGGMPRYFGYDKNDIEIKFKDANIRLQIRKEDDVGFTHVDFHGKKKLGVENSIERILNEHDVRRAWEQGHSGFWMVPTSNLVNLPTGGAVMSGGRYGDMFSRIMMLVFIFV